MAELKPCPFYGGKGEMLKKKKQGKMEGKGGE